MRIFTLLICAFVLFFECTAQASFKLRDTVSIMGGFDSNPLFQDGNNPSDYIMRVDPNLGFIFDKEAFYTDTGVGFSYNKYFKSSNQSYFKWNLNSLISIKPEEQVELTLINNYDNNSDPIMMDTETRAKWNLYTMQAGTVYTSKSKLWSIEGEFESLSTRYDLSTYKNFNNNKRFLTIISKFNFFPEDQMIFGYRGGFSYYPAGYNATPYGNSDSVHWEGFVGLKGKITRSIDFYAKLGFVYLDYQYGLDFHEPILELRVDNYITKINTLSVYYERMPYDSVYSNYYVDNRMALEFKNIWYDSMVNLSTFNYIYRYYRSGPKRIDNRLNFITETALPIWSIPSIKENISVFIQFMAEWINSDAYNSFGLYTGPDPSASYKRFVILVGFTNKY